MQRALGFLLFVASAALFGSDQAVSVQKLLEFLHSSVQQKFPDKQVAQYVARMKLSEKLDDKTIETLQGEGLGPKTLAALKELSASTNSLPVPVAAAPVQKPTPIPPPPYDEEQEVIHDITDYALNYTKRLPDFLCTQVTRRTAAPHGRDGWISLDTVIAKVSYVEGKENYELKLVNNTPVANKTLDQLSGSISTGEFGSMMHEVFDPHSGAELHFERWATLRGKRMYVFNYAIEQSRSKYSIDFDRKMRVVTAYKGLIFVEKQSHAIARITSEAVDIPASFPVREARERLDYDYAAIGTRDYLVPIVAEMNIRDSEVAFRNTIEFRSYKRFGADTQIQYDINYDDAAKPIDESKTREEAPK